MLKDIISLGLISRTEHCLNDVRTEYLAFLSDDTFKESLLRNQQQHNACLECQRITPLSNILDKAILALWLTTGSDRRFEIPR